jgi:hypothetical protein
MIPALRKIPRVLRYRATEREDLEAALQYALNEGHKMWPCSE